MKKILLMIMLVVFVIMPMFANGGAEGSLYSFEEVKSDADVQEEVAAGIASLGKAAYIDSLESQKNDAESEKESLVEKLSNAEYKTSLNPRRKRYLDNKIENLTAKLKKAEEYEDTSEEAASTQ